MKLLQTLFAEKRAFEKENKDIEKQIESKSSNTQSEEEMKERLFESERERILNLTLSLKFGKEQADRLLDDLRSTEQDAKALLEEKNNLTLDLA
jgi:hypothetical protein